MNLKEYASLNDITLADAKKRTGLTHWNQTVPEEEDTITLEEMIEEVVEVLEEVKPVEVAVAKAVVEVVKDLVSDEDKRKSVKGLGTKSPYWSELNG